MEFDPCEGPKHYNAFKNKDVFHAQSEQRFHADNGTLPTVVEHEIQHLLKCDLLILHFPLWWFGPPAILKGWMDRVFVYGRMYRSLMRYDQGICAGKKVIACVTTGASEASCSYNGNEGDTKLHLWPVLFPFRYLGFDVFEPDVFHGVGGVAFLENHEDGNNIMDNYFKQWKSSLDTLNERPTLKYNNDNEFDDSKKLIAHSPVYSPFVRHNPDISW